jgi:hypothetical protein
MYRSITIISILLCFIPIIVLVLKQMWRERLYLLIALYWLLNGLINIATLFNFKIDRRVDDFITLTANYLDVPMVLLIFYLASRGLYRKVIKYTLLSFIVFELIVTFIKGFNYDAITIILGVSLVVIISFSIAGIVAYLTRIQHSPQEEIMVFVYSSFLFFYGTFIIVYVFSYIIVNQNDSDNFLIYYLELLLASLPVTYAFLKFACKNSATRPARPKMDGF